MDDIVSLVRPEIYAMRPYSSARVEADQAVRIHLDANENPYPPYPGGSEQEGLNRYPEPQPPSLLRRFSEIYGLPVEQLFLSRGADEAIDLLVRAFCAAGRDAILITPPTFVMYETAAHIQGASVRQVPLLAGSYQLDTDAMLAACDADPGIKIVFVCSPNNPTANLMEHASVLRLAERLRGRAMVVVDELYLDYSGQPSLAGAIAEQPNLVVVRSLSKEYSLAGERCGITLAHPEVVGVLRRIMPPYPSPSRRSGRSARRSRPTASPTGGATSTASSPSGTACARPWRSCPPSSRCFPRTPTSCWYAPGSTATLRRAGRAGHQAAGPQRRDRRRGAAVDRHARGERRTAPGAQAPRLSRRTRSSAQPKLASRKAPRPASASGSAVARASARCRFVRPATTRTSRPSAILISASQIGSSP